MADNKVTVVAQIRAKNGMEETVKQELVGTGRSNPIRKGLHQV